MGFFNWAAPLFGHFADRWSDEQIAEIADWLSPYVRPGGSLLDVGGGTGALANRLSRALNASVTVLDPTPQMLRYVPDSASVTAILGTAENMPFEPSLFDAVIVTDAFHHFRDQPAAARESARVVRCGGAVIVLELDPRGPIMSLIVIAEKILGEPGAFFTPSEMCDFMAAHGIRGECTEMRGVSYRFMGEVQPQG